MTRAIWKKTRWHVYASDRGVRAMPRQLTDGERRPGKVFVASFEGVSRKTAVLRAKRATQLLAAV